MDTRMTGIPSDVAEHGAAPVSTDAMSADPAPGSGDDGWVTARIDRGHYTASVAARGHRSVLDEPSDVGGADAGPTPYETLLGALGACTAITLRMYADARGWPLDAVLVRSRAGRAHEPDCEVCDTTDVGPRRIERRIELEGPLSDEQRRRLLRVAARCPLHQTLERGVRVVDET